MRADPSWGEVVRTGAASSRVPGAEAAATGPAGPVRREDDERHPSGVPGAQRTRV
jgi:hypothetical protein